MRYLLLLALLPALAHASDPANSVKRYTEVQSLTRPEPAASCTAALSPEGMNLAYVRGFRVLVEAPVGQTFTGGTLRARYYSWGRTAWFEGQGNDFLLPVGKSRAVFEDVPVFIRTGCVLYVADGVTLSGAGTSITITLEAWYGGA